MKKKHKRYSKYGQTITITAPPACVTIKRRGCKTVEGTFYDDGSMLFDTFDATRNLKPEAKKWLRRTVDELADTLKQ